MCANVLQTSPLTQGAVTTSLPSQPVTSHFLSSASSSSSSSSHASAVRLDPLDLELLKSKKKRKHIGALKQNKVQPAEQVGPQEKPRPGWEEVPRRHSSGIIKLHSSRESLGDSQRTASDGDILVRLPPLPPLVSEVPSVASKKMCYVWSAIPQELSTVSSTVHLLWLPSLHCSPVSRIR